MARRAAPRCCRGQCCAGQSRAIPASPGHRAERGTRARIARLILENGPGHRGRAGHQARPDPGRGPPAPGQPAGRGHDRDQDGPRATATGAAAGRPGCSRSPTRAAAPSSTPTTTWPPARCASWPRRPGPDAVAEFARRQVSDLERRYRPVVEAAPPARQGQALAEALSADGYAASATRSPAAERAAPASSSASTTARWPTSPPSTRSSARRRPRRSAGCSARRCSAWPRSPTATASAPPTSPRRRWCTPASHTAAAPQPTAATTKSGGISA